MIDKNIECDIVSDLLPLYLEGKTGLESNTFVKNHLKQCDKCRKNLKYMEASYEDIIKNISNESEIRNKKQKTIKPFRKAKGKILVCGYLLILALFWIYMLIFLFP